MPFTQDSKPAILLPNGSRYTELAILQAHQRSHAGVESIVVQFRSNGYWVVQAGKLAKMIKGWCVICRYLDKPLLGQRMGLRRMQFTNAPSVWQQIEIYLMGPFKCRGDKNPRVSVKVWGAVIQDVYSGAVHADVVRDYSAQVVMETLRKVAALRG